MSNTIQVPANSVYAGGTPYAFAKATFKVKTVTNLRAGVFVVRDTTASEIKAAGTGAKNVIGVLTEKNLTNPEWDPTTAPAAGDEIEVLLVGSGAWAKVRNKADLKTGDYGVTDSTGRLVAAVAIAVAVPAGGTAVTSDAAQPDLTETGSLPPGGETFKVLKDSDGSGAETDAVVVL